MVPQAVVARASPWIGATCQSLGADADAADRRGSAPPTRALLLALLPGPWLLVAGQSISGISAAVFGVMLPLVAADLTSDRRHFNLCIGAFGLCSAAGTTLSTAAGGWISDNAGQVPAFLALAAAGLAGTLAIGADAGNGADPGNTPGGNTRPAGANRGLTGVSGPG